MSIIILGKVLQNETRHICEWERFILSKIYTMLARFMFNYPGTVGFWSFIGDACGISCWQLWFG